jgi:hypothetical protein
MVMLCAAVSVCAQQPAVTFSGTVTDQNTGQGIGDVAIVALGDQTGTRVAVTDAQGNYTLPFGANTNIKLRAYKPTFIFNPISTTLISFGGFPITGARTRDFSGASFPFAILIFAQPPILLTADESLDALTLDGVLHMRDPFTPINNDYFGPDKRTRIKLFLADLDLYSGETLSLITVQALDAQQGSHVLSVEDRRKVPGVPWLFQLTVLLPSGLTVPNDLSVSVLLRGHVSNLAKLRIQ